MIKTYFLYCEAALSCDYSRCAAAMDQNILLKVTSRAVEGLREPQGSLLCSYFMI